MDDIPFGSSAYIQAERIIRIETPLGADVLLPERCEVREGVNSLFEINISVRSKKTDIQPADIVGKLVDVSLELDGAGKRRPWNGLVTEMHEGPAVTRGLRSYALTIRPQLWLMSQKSDCRIWMDKSAVDVLQTLTQEHGFPSAQVITVDRVPPQHYSVQWNETDLDYLRRRLEEDGLFFWHVHEKGKHTLYVSNAQNGYRNGEETDVRLSFGSSDRNHLNQWRKRYLYTPGKRTASDWNFETPGDAQRGDTPSKVKLPRNGSYELYEYPARIANRDEAERASKLRMQATEVDHERIEGAALVRTLAPGQRFKPYEVAHPDHVYEPHIILDIRHVMIDRSYETNEMAPEYENSFTALPARLPATPHRTTHRPRLDATQVGIIAGPSGEEIHTDQYGRVKLWFPWDRRAKKDGEDTCWVRVAQNWAGANWGGQVIPRVGMEAMVAYLDGDPDRPIVVGLVPNPQQKVPYDLPGNKTRMVMRSNSYKSKGRNELTLEDATGQENMFLHAQKDMTGRVLNNHTHRVDANAVTSVGQNHSLEVAGNHNNETGGSQNNVVGATGPAVQMAMTALTPMLGQTASLAQSAVATAASFLGGGGGGAAVPAPTAGGGIGGMIGSVLSGSLMGTLMPMISKGASALVGALGQQGRQGVVAGSDPTANAGDALRRSGGQMAQQGLAALFGGQSGVQNNLITSARNTNIGAIDVQTVGQTKVLNVGSTSVQNVGHIKKTIVGEEYVIEVGESKMIMKKDGTVIIVGTNFYFAASGPVQINGKVVHNN